MEITEQDQKPAGFGHTHYLWFCPVHRHQTRIYSCADDPHSLDLRYKVCNWPTGRDKTCGRQRQIMWFSMGTLAQVNAHLHGIKTGENREPIWWIWLLPKEEQEKQEVKDMWERFWGAHHGWCNFFMGGPAHTCEMCSGLKADYPELTGDTLDSLMKRYFPNNKRVA